MYSHKAKGSLTQGRDDDHAQLVLLCCKLRRFALSLADAGYAGMLFRARQQIPAGAGLLLLLHCISYLPDNPGSAAATSLAPPLSSSNAACGAWSHAGGGSRPRVVAIGRTHSGERPSQPGSAA